MILEKIMKHSENLECIKINLFYLHFIIRILLRWEFKIRIGDNKFIYMDIDNYHQN